MSRKYNAFTLIELLVVISIIALLVAILLPALNEARTIARRTVGMAGMKQIGTAFHNYCSDFKGFLPPSALGGSNAGPGQVGQSSFQNIMPWYSENVIDARPNQIWWKGGDMNISTSYPKWWNVGCLYGTGVVDSHKIFYPHGHVKLTDPRWDFFYDITLYTDPQTGRWVWEKYPETLGYDIGRIPYQYFKPMLAGQPTRTIDKINAYPFFFDTMHHWSAIPYKGSNGEPKGLTTLYGDGHAAYRTDQKLFNEDMLREACGGIDPWNRAMAEAVNQGPGDNAQSFLYLYLLLCDLNPLSISVDKYFVTDERNAHFWK
jgi:prepilin-type N-terminal cleavage/methylation domain-containing protein